MKLFRTTFATSAAIFFGGLITVVWPADAPRNVSQLVERGGLPKRVHVFEDHGTELLVDLLLFEPGPFGRPAIRVLNKRHASVI